MTNRKNIAFFILFMLYLVVFFTGYKYIGKGIIYASVPMIFGAAVIYNYFIGFVVVLLNIPATLFLMYFAGTPFSVALTNINPFVVLLQCVCVAIPSIIKIYNEKKDTIRSREANRIIDKLSDEILYEKELKEKYITEINEMKLIIERYKTLLEEKRDTDILTGVQTRDAIIRKMQRYIVLGSQKVYVFIYLRKLKEINKTQGIFEGDAYIRKIAGKILKISKEIGRISVGTFLLIAEKSSIDEINKKIKDEFDDELEIVIVKQDKKDDVSEIFKRGIANDR